LSRPEGLSEALLSPVVTPTKGHMYKYW
jgi:hypothetical protein